MARVRRFGLNGRYRSSTSCFVSARSMRPAAPASAALLGDRREHRGAPGGELAEVLAAIAHVAQLHLVETARGLLPVARDEGELVPLANSASALAT
jgi:hypothetical protein